MDISGGGRRDVGTVEGMTDARPPHVPGYRLTRLLDAGASARVWRARRESDDSLVAIKVVPDADPAAVEEWTLLQHAASEHVVGLHEVVEVDTDDGPALALVLDLLSGGSLGSVVAQRGHLSVGETVTVLTPVASALDSLHELGVIHGDLSPGNVLLDPTGRPVVADLGVSRLTASGPRDVHGTDGFVAPEVLLGDDPGRASDVYALGALAWLCLTGSAPGHIAVRADLTAAAPQASDAMTALVEECLAPDPDERPTADDVAMRCYESAEPEPLRLTVPGDLATGLTRRIRDAAGDASDDSDLPWHRLAAEPETPGRWGRWRERRRGRRAARQEGPAAEEQPGRHRADGGRRGERWVPTLAAAAAAGVVIAVVVPGWTDGPGAEAVEPSQVVQPDRPTASSRSAAAAVPPSASRDPLRSRSAPRTHPRGVVEALTDLRRRVVVEQDRSALALLDLPDSPAARADAEHLARLESRGEGYRGVELVVREAATRSTSGTSAVLRARVDESSYAVRGRDGTLEDRPARAGEPVDLVLRWHEGRWRLSEVRSVPDPG